MNAHTKGPWQIVGPSVTATLNGWGRAFIDINAVNEASAHIALIPAGHGENGDANARLIAAAPELLHICQKIAGFLAHGDNEEVTDDTWLEIAAECEDELKTAIRKATGHE